jgi:hypothetical protein
MRVGPWVRWKPGGAQQIEGRRYPGGSQKAFSGFGILEEVRQIDLLLHGISWKSHSYPGVV